MLNQTLQRDVTTLKYFVEYDSKQKYFKKKIGLCSYCQVWKRFVLKTMIEMPDLLSGMYLSDKSIYSEFEILESIEHHIDVDRMLKTGACFIKNSIRTSLAANRVIIN